ncbi:phosphate ABC transporter substrate-binding protein PstS [Coleofasciculus sp. FACHB-1120]|uniref:phosphate ABC transporter substrate-binding protein PstS n=1 Tax=Coleofasciculus sp. FACHB-1120 TaxID=2692783 RepID=UPI0018EF4259|nr:phosphate ABC transporter substrate-binding protein PstS [Coleofasciculus sp. FACHB-1120]
MRSKPRAFLIPAIALSLSVAACQSPNTTPTSSPAAGTTGSATPAAAGGGGGSNVSLTGAGASFPAPLYQRWFSEYNKQNPNVQVSYQSVGSGAGVEQFTQGTVNFGASDTGMKPEEITKVAKGAVLLPMTAGSIVLGYNLPDVKGLKLPRAVYTDIFLGKIKNWNDPRIAQANPGLTLPDRPITVIHRSDGSGTTSVFTQHLSAISPAWKSGPGAGKTVNWPVGVGAKGNEGVTAQLLQSDGAIGYVEYGYAKQQNIPTAALENKSGKFIEPSGETAANALAAVTLPADLQAYIADPEGENSYPIVTYTWIMAYKTYEDPQKAQALKNVLKWSLTEGQKYSEELGYVPLPQPVVTKVQAAVDSIKP